ncbi:hypothetical protein GCM10018953_31170 [Streptosporangium nondiastaticum]
MAAFAAPSPPRWTACATCSTPSTPAGLRLLVTFGSIIGRAGLHGEAHYATANEWLAETHQGGGRQAPPLSRRLHGVVGLVRRRHGRAAVGGGGAGPQGISPITPQQGVQIMRRLVADPDVPPVVVISGRTEGIDTVR